MDLKEARSIIKTITDRDLVSQQFVDEAAAQRVAEAYSLVLDSPYIGVRRGYTFRVEPEEGAVQLVVRKPAPE